MLSTLNEAVHLEATLSTCIGAVYLEGVGVGEAAGELARGKAVGPPATEGRSKATWKREFKLPWREAGPPNLHDDKMDSDQKVVNKELSLSDHLQWSSVEGSGLSELP